MKLEEFEERWRIATDNGLHLTKEFEEWVNSPKAKEERALIEQRIKNIIKGVDK